MDLNEKKILIENLIKKLNDAASAYYSEAEDIMSDKEYDDLYESLAILEKETGIVLPESPTFNVGYQVLSKLEKITHSIPMMSLDKTKDEHKLIEFLNGKNGLISWKLDGLAVELTYENGKLSMAVTRGNGVIGENITHNAKFFVNIPKRIDFKGKLKIRGEAVISFKDFEKINDSLDEKERYKNPRNLCSGTVRQLDNSVSKNRPVNFFAYTLTNSEELEFSTKSASLIFLENTGFQVVEYTLLTSEEIPEEILKFKQKINSNPFATDGLVLTFDDIEYSKSLGETSKFPKDSIAFKWADEACKTELITVEWNASRTGLINPIAIFKPITIEGTTVERASLHNVTIFESHYLGVGDTILVYKANMIIPQLLENITKSNSLKPPEFCPICGGVSEIETTNASKNETKLLYCKNPNCPAKTVRTIVHYTSRDAMNIEGFSEQTIQKFFDLGYISNYADIYNLTAFEKEIISLKGFGQRSYDKILSSIEKSKNCQLHNFIYALGINNVGLVNAKILCKHFDYDINKIISAQYTELIELPNFGEIIAKSLTQYFTDKTNLDIMYKTIAYLNFEPVQLNSALLLGKIFVITGDLISFSNRKELQSLIERHGGKVSSSVSPKTNYLINNDKMSNSTKNKRAKELGIEIISEEDFIKLINV